MENKKHAYLIMAHSEPELLCTLIGCLDDKRNDIYIHLDSKFESISENELRQKIEHSNVYFVSRKPIYWSGYSQIDCELRLLKESTKIKYAYYHLLSGVDMPIKSQNYIHNFFEEHKGKQFLSVTKVKTWKIASRYRHFHFQNINRRLPRKLSRTLRYPFSLLQTILLIDRFRNSDLKDFYWGQAWFSITYDFAKHIVKKNDYIQNNFNNGFFNDEVFMQTLLMNSKYGKDLSPLGYVRLIDWQRGKPYTWTSNEFDEIMSSKALFSRKFSMTMDENLVNKIVEQIT